MKNVAAKSRKALALKVQQICRRKNLAPKALAEDAKCNVRTIRNFFNGEAVKESTMRLICGAVGIDFDQVINTETGTTRSSDPEHGSYSEALIQDYIGYFYAYRRSFTASGKFLRSLFKFEWDGNRSCLRFDEFQTYDSSRLKRKVNYDQTGEVFISNTVGLVHLLTTRLGALRLITLTRLHHDENTMRGLVLTQAEWPDHFQPAVSPIYFQKIQAAVAREQLLKRVGPIEAVQGDEYQQIKTMLEQIETDVAFFAK